MSCWAGLPSGRNVTAPCSTGYSHQAVDDYQSMNFEFPDENIMLVTDYEEPGPE